ncbi:MAG: serine/threonine-protein phosphatase [Rhodocyclaceae bacterium]|nr:serine/threonine-protein phosphatase [Pseudomonadota bacterium]MDQ7971325.1 serine/threonine-protein phosphatase [Rhodocyclaceae bacterium]MDQ7999015.1 serine/threonine-protein phosphatase [Pseudomonadota bacterium]MDQ8016637.1 serine/threonine-protein phosphatase [Pseudomonadota bacterium]
MKFSVFQVSRKGGRVKNEDRMGYCYTRESGLFVLADGMGGHPEGEVAAQLALQTIAALYQREARPTLKDVKTFLASAVMAAHQQIMRYASNKAMLDTPRTTVVAAVLQGNTATWIHCGDSRLYVVRDGQMLMRTRDHSHAERPRPHAGNEPVNRNLLLTCLGSPSTPLFEVSAPLTLQQGDRLMLCSDGLWGVMDDLLLVRSLSTGKVSDAAPELVEMALRRGGPNGDNVTLIAIEWETPDVPGADPGVSTDGISDDVFASTIQAGMPADGEIDDLDDDAIERSIAEINDAIRRSAASRKS